MWHLMRSFPQLMAILFESNGSRANLVFFCQNNAVFAATRHGDTFQDMQKNSNQQVALLTTLNACAH